MKLFTLLSLISGVVFANPTVAPKFLPYQPKDDSVGELANAHRIQIDLDEIEGVEIPRDGKQPNVTVQREFHGFKFVTGASCFEFWPKEACEKGGAKDWKETEMDFVSKILTKVINIPGLKEKIQKNGFVNIRRSSFAAFYDAGKKEWYAGDNVAAFVNSVDYSINFPDMTFSDTELEIPATSVDNPSSGGVLYSEMTVFHELVHAVDIDGYTNKSNISYRKDFLGLFHLAYSKDDQKFIFPGYTTEDIDRVYEAIDILKKDRGPRTFENKERFIRVTREAFKLKETMARKLGYPSLYSMEDMAPTELLAELTTFLYFHEAFLREYMNPAILKWVDDHLLRGARNSSLPSLQVIPGHECSEIFFNQ